MNSYPSNNFSTVFFLVVLFIGMGVLIYNTFEITIENGQLKETVGTLQASVETLNIENTALKTANATFTDENSILKATVEKAVAENTSLNTENAMVWTTNAALTDENRKLNATLEKVVAENASLITQNSVLWIANASLADENSKLKASGLTVQQIGNGESGNPNRKVLLSSFLPTDLETWMKVIVVVLVIAIFVVGYNVYKVLRGVQRRKAAVLARMHTAQALPRNNRFIHVIDSHFVDR